MKTAYLKEKTAFYLRDCSTFQGKFTDLLLLAINLSACVLYVYATYTDPQPLWLKTAEFAVFIFFIMEYLIRVWVAESKFSYIFSFYGLIDLFSIIPYLIPELRFIRALKVLRILRFLRFLETEEFFFGKISRIQLQAAKTVFTVFTIIFVSAGFIIYPESNSSTSNINTFGESIYFCVITLSTVGFGDLTPVTELGKTFTVIMILGGATLIPYNSYKLIKAIGQSRNENSLVCEKCGLRNHDSDASHCKACGAVIFRKKKGFTDI